MSLRGPRRRRRTSGIVFPADVGLPLQGRRNGPRHNAHVAQRESDIADDVAAVERAELEDLKEAENRADEDQNRAEHIEADPAAELGAGIEQVRLHCAGVERGRGDCGERGGECGEGVGGRRGGGGCGRCDHGG